MKKLILGILLFTIPFAAQSQIDSTIFRHESRIIENGIESYTKIFLKDAFTYTDSVIQENFQIQVYNLSLAERIVELKEVNSKLLEDIERLEIALNEEREKLRVIADIAKSE